MARVKSLPPKLEAVVIRLGRSAKLNVTQAVKLPYIVDVVANRLLGRRITEGNHEAWDKGVVTSQVWHYLTKRGDSPVFHLESMRWSEERKLVIDSDSEPPALTPEEEAIVDFVAREFAGVRAGDLGRLTKLMNPEVSRWGSNRRASVGQDAFDRLSNDYQEMAEAVSALTLDQLRQGYEVVENIEDAAA